MKKRGRFRAKLACLVSLVNCFYMMTRITLTIAASAAERPATPLGEPLPPPPLLLPEARDDASWPLAVQPVQVETADPVLGVDRPAVAALSNVVAADVSASMANLYTMPDELARREVVMVVDESAEMVSFLILDGGTLAARAISDRRLDLIRRQVAGSRITASYARRIFTDRVGAVDGAAQPFSTNAQKSLVFVHAANAFMG